MELIIGTHRRGSFIAGQAVGRPGQLELTPQPKRPAILWDELHLVQASVIMGLRSEMLRLFDRAETRGTAIILLALASDAFGSQKVMKITLTGDFQGSAHGAARHQRG